MDQWTGRAILWGVIAGLSFLIMLRFYTALTASPIGWEVQLGLTFGVGIAAILVVPRFERWYLRLG